MRHPDRPTRRWPAFVAVLAAAAILFGSFLPVDKRSLLHANGPLHPLVHLVLFGVLSWLAAWGTRSTNARVVLCVVIAALGCSTEVIEWHLYGNPLEYTDMIVDAMGAVIGTGLGALTAPLLHRNAQDKGPR